MPNICIIPSGDRQGQANLIHHYSKIGWNVYLPKHGTENLNWKITATWPRLLCRSLRNPDKRNLDIHGFERTKDNIFGEDRFIQIEDNGPLYEDRTIVCELADFEKEKVSIDAFHTLRGSDDYLKNALSFAEKCFPGAVWISSTISPHSQTPPLGIVPENVCRMMPAKYVPDYSDKNFFDFYPSGFEFDLLNVKKDEAQRSGFASFNHNFQKRFPRDYQLFRLMNERLKKSGIAVTNYGSNVKGQGADTTSSYKKIELKENFLPRMKKLLIRAINFDFTPDPTWPTLSVRQAAELTTRLKAIVHFKETDWGGGVVWYALAAGTPIITHQSYVNKARSEDILIDGYNAIIVANADSAAEAILKLEREPEYSAKLSAGMKEKFQQLINEGYWKRFENFANKALEEN